jgi:hypothetical protein
VDERRLSRLFVHLALGHDGCGSEGESQVDLLEDYHLLLPPRFLTRKNILNKSSTIEDYEYSFIMDYTANCCE